MGPILALNGPSDKPGTIRLKASRGPFAEFFRGIASQPHLLDYADLTTMDGLTVVDVLLMLGLFTRLAALGVICLILLFYLCHPPFIGCFYARPSEGSYLIVNKNLVELCAPIVIVLTGSGRFAGLDGIVHGLAARFRRPRLAPA
jgi:thiosulfate dehydrogenase [quinone] large subunit